MKTTHMTLVSLLALAAIVLSGCTHENASNQNSAVNGRVNTNAAVANAPSGNVGQTGPYTHKVYVASSVDGITWTNDSDEPILEHASVPSAIVRDDGSIVVYVVDASNGPDTFGCTVSSDNGVTFENGNCTIQNLTVNRTVDFSIVQLEDGRYRLYFFGSNGFTGDPGSGEGDHDIYSAISDDGITFTQEAKVFSYEGLVDPDVFWNGSEWVMQVHSLTVNKTVVATSTDGTSFTYRGTLVPERYGVTKPVLLADETFRMYAFKQGEQTSFYSMTSEDGFTWTMEGGIRLEAPNGYEITDPFVVELHDQTYKMFYKLSAKPTPGTK